MTLLSFSTVNFKGNHFEIFGLPVAYALDLSLLEQRYLDLQKEVHPDRFAGDEAQKRLAMQWATLVNRARATLKDPLERAVYILRLKHLELEENPVLPPDFLAQQVELREELEDLQGHPDRLRELGRFKGRVRSVMTSLEEEFARALDGDKDKQEETGQVIVYKLQFMNKLLESAKQLEEKLLDY